MKKYFKDYIYCLKDTYRIAKPNKIFSHLAEFLIALMFWVGLDLIFNFIKTYNYRRKNENRP